MRPEVLRVFKKATPSLWGYIFFKKILITFALSKENHRILEDAMPIYTDRELVEMIQSGDQRLWEDALRYLYEADSLGLWRKIHAHVTKRGGAVADAEDVFHEVLIVAERRLREGAFLQESSLVTYIVAIAKGVWQNKLRKTQRLILKQDSPMPDLTEKSVEELFINQEKREIIQSAIQLLPERCREAMTLSTLGFVNREIIERLNLKNEKQADNKLTRCRKILRSILQKIMT
jgi:RNA polymerase sigma factor (sigma-70 family)